MNKYYRLIILFLISSSLHAADNDFFIGKGTWLAKLDVAATQKVNNIPANLTYIVESCTVSSAKFHVSEDGEQFFIASTSDVEISSEGDLYFAHMINKGKAWTEKLAFTIAKTSATEGAMQMSRMISNHGEREENSFRVFGLLGSGGLKKISDDCGVLQY